MPGMTGIELIELLHDTGQSLPTVILTSIVDERAHARSAALGAHAWLTKPVTDERLLAALASAIHTQLPHSDFRSEEHTSELQSLMRISYAVFRSKKKTTTTNQTKGDPASHNKPPHGRTISCVISSTDSQRITPYSADAPTNATCEHRQNTMPHTIQQNTQSHVSQQLQPYR